MREVRIVAAMALVLATIAISLVALCHRIDMRISVVNETDRTIVVEVKVYFPGAGPARGASVMAFQPGCESTMCPPECRPLLEARTDDKGIAVLEIPKVNGTWIIAAAPDPAHRVCRELSVAAGRMEVREERHVLPEHVAAALGAAILLSVFGISYVLVRRRKSSA